MANTKMNHAKSRRAELNERAAAHKQRMNHPSGKGKYAMRKKRQEIEARTAEHLAKKGPQFVRNLPFGGSSERDERVARISTGDWLFQSAEAQSH